MLLVHPFDLKTHNDSWLSDYKLPNESLSLSVDNSLGYNIHHWLHTAALKVEEIIIATMPALIISRCIYYISGSNGG